MKIEKTDMEFVTFDAQDVIMTSTTTGGGGGGGLSQIFFQMTPSLASGQTAYTDNTVGYWNYKSGRTTTTYRLTMNGSIPLDGYYYRLTEDTSIYAPYEDGINTIDALTGVESSPTAFSEGTQYNDLDDIFGWIEDYLQ